MTDISSPGQATDPTATSGPAEAQPPMTLPEALYAYADLLERDGRSPHFMPAARQRHIGARLRGIVRAFERPQPQERPLILVLSVVDPEMGTVSIRTAPAVPDGEPETIELGGAECAVLRAGGTLVWSLRRI